MRFVHFIRTRIIHLVKPKKKKIQHVFVIKKARLDWLKLCKGFEPRLLQSMYGSMYRLDKSIFRNSEKKLKLELYKVTLSNKIQNSPLKMQEEKKIWRIFLQF
jgi:hypothetical protein